MAKFEVVVMYPQRFTIESLNIDTAEQQLIKGVAKWNRDRPTLPNAFHLSIEEVVEDDKPTE